MKRNRTQFSILFAVLLIVISSVSHAVSLSGQCICSSDHAQYDSPGSGHHSPDHSMPGQKTNSGNGGHGGDCESKSLCCASPQSAEPVVKTPVGKNYQTAVSSISPFLTIDVKSSIQPPPLIAYQQKFGEPTIYILNCSFLI